MGPMGNQSGSSEICVVKWWLVGNMWKEQYCGKLWMPSEELVFDLMDISS